MSEENISKNFDFLTNIGLTLNESRVYLTLLKYGEFNGYETSKFSGY